MTDQQLYAIGRCVCKTLKKQLVKAFSPTRGRKWCREKSTLELAAGYYQRKNNLSGKMNNLLKMQ